MVTLTLQNKKTLKEAFKEINRNELARQLGLHRRNLIDQIASAHTFVSAKRAKEIERLTEGKIIASILRPDIFDPTPGNPGTRNTA